MVMEKYILTDSDARAHRVQIRYEALRAGGRHGHYESMFRVVNEEVAHARRETLEEAAQVCDAYSLEAWGIPEEQCAAQQIAAAIRALKEK